MMARQTRSEATRRKILNAAVHVFNEVGLFGRRAGPVIERAEMTKGALYQHFDSMESLGVSHHRRRLRHSPQRLSQQL
jgi:AcrR family transcriptional regulator